MTDLSTTGPLSTESDEAQRDLAGVLSVGRYELWVSFFGCGGFGDFDGFGGFGGCSEFIGRFGGFGSFGGFGDGRGGRAR